jgi:ABC-type multidrug transport system fused ATPase/permease subunit
MRWFVADSILRYKWYSLAVLITGFLGVTFQVQVFFLIIQYARHFSSGEIITIAGHAFDPRSSLALLGAGSLAITVSLVLATLCIYFSKRTGLWIGRRYEEFCSRRVFHLLGQTTDTLFLTQQIENADTYLSKLIKGDARFCGRVVRMMLTLIVPGLTLVVAVTILVYLEPLLTAIITLILIGFTYCQYIISNRAAAYSVRFETMSSLSGRAYKDLLHHFKHQFPVDPDQAFVDKTYAGGPVKHQLDAFEGRLKMPVVSELTSGVFTAFILGLIVFIMGASIIREGSGWGRLLVYVLALRYAMTNLQQSFSIITSINRFYPQARRHFHFVRTFHDNDRKPGASPETYEARVDDGGALEGSLQSLTLKRGTRLALVTPQSKLNHYTVITLMESLLGDSVGSVAKALASTRLVIPAHSCPYQSLRRILNLTPKTTWSDIQGWFPDEEAWRDFKRNYPGNLDKQLGPQVWDTISEKNKLILGLLSAVRSDAQWVTIDMKGLLLLERREACHFLDMLQNKIVVLATNKHNKKIGAFNETYVAVVSEERLWGIGTPEWFAKVEATVEDMITQKKEQSDFREGEDDDIEDNE